MFIFLNHFSDLLSNNSYEKPQMEHLKYICREIYHTVK